MATYLACCVTIRLYVLQALSKSNMLKGHSCLNVLGT